ncbi:hypothetical protein DEO72_LG2g2952 [Vigna unguiculata]|uniref:Uncharacterized protein n=1 Tax=Vigna unguiculata TaxID=3917 RepID=A0A4D6L280_VIGUN|nr:hypothetical protein DEO72_LG2g2952 [Vigna unguiculata]
MLTLDGIGKGNRNLLESAAKGRRKVRCTAWQTRGYREATARKSEACGKVGVRLVRVRCEDNLIAE